MKLKLSENSISGALCGPSVLLSFDVYDVPNVPMFPVEIYSYLNRGEYTVAKSKSAIHIQDELTGTGFTDRADTKLYPTMSAFIKYLYDKGITNKYDVIFFSNGHVMCIKDGFLTDTAKMHGRTRVRNYALIEKK